MKKILLVPFVFFPDPCGGTEVYVEALARKLTRGRFQSVIAAPGSRNGHYKHNDLPIFRFATASGALPLEYIYGEGDPVAAVNFEVVLDQTKPDLVHFHAMTPAISIRLLRMVKQKNLPVVYTYHTPTATCQRGTLLKWGNQVCDGLMIPEECSPCSLNGKGVSMPIALGLQYLSKAIGPALEKTEYQGGAWTALRTPQLVKNKIQTTLEFFHSVDHIVAVCDWVQKLLVLNGIPENKITLSRQGLCHEGAAGVSFESRGNLENSISSSPEDDRPLSMVFLGRIDPTKGIHIVIKAMCLVPQANVRLTIHGVAQGLGAQKYEKHLRKLASVDQRIQFAAPISSAEVIPAIRNHDLLVVPSQWLETGPLVVLEAFAAGAPVLGSNLGGIAELVQEKVNGFLVEASNIQAWAKRILDLSMSRGTLVDLKKAIKPPKTMNDVALEMYSIYCRFIAG